MNEDLLTIVKQYIFKHTADNVNTLYNDLHNLRHVNITKQKVKEIKDEFNEILDIVSMDNLNKKIVFPYIGGWFFDIITNRGLKLVTDQEENFDPSWAVFCHGNSGYILAYPTNSKSAATLTTIFKEFKKDCDNLTVYVYNSGAGQRRNEPVEVDIKYPVKMVVSDMERGWGKFSDTGLPFDVGILKMNAKENHRFLSRINSFASTLRRKYIKDGTAGNQQRTISEDEFNAFVYTWNLAYISFHGCTRGEMLADRTLELAYIAAALYWNENAHNERSSMIQEGDIVIIREPDKKFNAPIQQSKLLYSKYRIVSKHGNEVELVNAYNDQDKRKVHYNAIRGIYKKDVKDLIDKNPEGKLPKVQTANVRRIVLPPPPPRRNQTIQPPPDNRQRAEEAYNEQQERWMQLGFAPNLLSKTKYEIIEKLKEKFDNDTMNYVVGEDKDKKSFNKKVIEGIRRRMNIAAGVILNKQNIPRTDGFDQSGQLLTRRGNPVQIN